MLFIIIILLIVIVLIVMVGNHNLKEGQMLITQNQRHLSNDVNEVLSKVKILLKE